MRIKRPQVFPWQVLFACVYDINWQVFPWQGALFKTWSCQLLNKAPCQGKTCQFMSYTRANKTCQGNIWLSVPGLKSRSRKTCSAVVVCAWLKWKTFCNLLTWSVGLTTQWHKVGKLLNFLIIFQLWSNSTSLSVSPTTASIQGDGSKRM